MERNCGVKCDVLGCKHNVSGVACDLESIKVTCGCGSSCTCCGSYAEK